MVWKLCGFLYCVLKYQHRSGSKRSWLSQLITHAPSRKHHCLQCGVGLYKLGPLISKKLLRVNVCAQCNSARQTFSLDLPGKWAEWRPFSRLLYKTVLLPPWPSPRSSPETHSNSFGMFLKILLYYIYGNPWAKRNVIFIWQLPSSGTEWRVTFESDNIEWGTITLNNHHLWLFISQHCSVHSLSHAIESQWSQGQQKFI